MHLRALLITLGAANLSAWSVDCGLGSVPLWIKDKRMKMQLKELAEQVIVITGASRVSQVQENMKALDVVPKLTVEVMKAIEAATAV